MYKDGRPVLGQHNIWRSGKITSMKAKAQTGRVQSTSHRNLGNCVSSANPSHHSATGDAVYYVHPEFASMGDSR